MLPDFSAYCLLLADLPVQFSINGYVLTVWELLDLSDRTIRKYSYELDKEGQRVWWYDPMAHPENPTLQVSFPHHKHVHPNIKHNRVPAPDLSFGHPNVPILLKEIEALLNE